MTTHCPVCNAAVANVPSARCDACGALYYVNHRAGVAVTYPVVDGAPDLVTLICDANGTDEYDRGVADAVRDFGTAGVYGE